MQLHLKRQKGAFLVIALILIIVLSALGIAAMSEAISANRISSNYSAYLDALDKATSMAQYAKRILESYPDGQYPGPATCTSTGTCNVINNTFPHDGRPTLAWSSGLGTATMNGSSESNQWWIDHGFGYEGTFAGSGTARVVVALLGTNTSSPYQRTYKIVGYATDKTGKVKATYEMFHVWNGYTPDPGNGTCAGLCNYASCCSVSNTCSGSQASCEGATATYVPPGWTCANYFVNGLGYNATACNNPVAPP